MKRLVPGMMVALTAAAIVADPPTMQPTRATAVRDCAVTSRSYSETTWGSMQTHQYRTCMMQRRERME